MNSRLPFDLFELATLLILFRKFGCTRITLELPSSCCFSTVQADQLTAHSADCSGPESTIEPAQIETLRACGCCAEAATSLATGSRSC